MTSVGIIGGTGPLGRGLAARFVRAGLPVRVGSRDPAKAEEAADGLRELVGGDAAVVGVANAEATSADVVVLAVPFAGLDAVLPPLAASLEGSLVVCAVNPMAFDDRGPYTLPVEEGCAALAVALRLPGTRLTAAFHTLSARELLRLERPMDDDVVVVGDDGDDVAEVVALAALIDGCRGVPGGALRLAAGLEALTPILVEVNRRHRVHVGVRLARL